MEIGSVISLLVGTASLFAGIIFAMIGSANKERYIRQDKVLADHGVRIQYLERRDAVRDTQFDTLVAKLDELGDLWKEHTHSHRRKEDT